MAGPSLAHARFKGACARDDIIGLNWPATEAWRHRTSHSPALQSNGIRPCLTALAHETLALGFHARLLRLRPRGPAHRSASAGVECNLSTAIAPAPPSNFRLRQSGRQAAFAMVSNTPVCLGGHSDIPPHVAGPKAENALHPHSRH